MPSISRTRRYGAAITLALSVAAAAAGPPDAVHADGPVATTAHLSHPRGVAVDAAATAYVADTYAHKVREVTPAGAIGQGAAARSLTARVTYGNRVIAHATLRNTLRRQLRI